MGNPVGSQHLLCWPCAPSDLWGPTLLRLLNIKALQGEQPQLLTRQDRDDAHNRLLSVSGERHLYGQAWLAYLNGQVQEHKVPFTPGHYVLVHNSHGDGSQAVTQDGSRRAVGQAGRRCRYRWSLAVLARRPLRRRLTRDALELIALAGHRHDIVVVFLVRHVGMRYCHASASCPHKAVGLRVFGR